MCILGYMQSSSGKNTVLIYNLDMAWWVRQRAVGKVSPDETLNNAVLRAGSTVNCKGFRSAILKRRGKVGYLTPWSLSLIPDFHSVQNPFIGKSIE